MSCLPRSAAKGGSGTPGSDGQQTIFHGLDSGRLGMAKKDNAKAKTTPPAATTKDRRFLKYCLVLIMGGLVTLAWVSVLTFSPEDRPNIEVAYDQSPQAQNAVGVIGAYVSYGLLYYLGGGAYVGLAMATVAA